MRIYISSVRNKITVGHLLEITSNIWIVAPYIHELTFVI